MSLSTSPGGETPELSVVVPTYNRAPLLARTLAALAAQRYPTERFEVIVSDDGSSDDTPAVVRSFADRLRVTYTFQEDLGFRVAQARNAGARRAAASLLAFVDTGMLVGPDWVREHLDAHREPGTRAVLGYTFGYNPARPCQEMLDLPETLPPELLVERLRALPSFQDMRDPDFARVGYEPGRMAMPWVFLWTLNLSLPAAEFWATGGFDEEFRGWGVEDIEFGWRLHRRGTPMVVSMAGWGVEAPHQRQTSANKDSILRNCLRFLHKHPGPQPELYWAVSTRGLIDPLEIEWEALETWRLAARDRDVTGEIARATADLAPASGLGGAAPRVAVLGCGGRLPSELVASGTRLTLCDFDRELLDRVVPAGAADRCTTLPALGMRTVLPDLAVDRVVVTSRLAGAWQSWGEFVLAEARRIGGDVRVPFLSDVAAGAVPGANAAGAAGGAG